MTDTSDFSPMLNFLVDEVGMSKAGVELLAQQRGGMRIATTKKVTPNHWLAKLIGEQDARKLGEYYQGEEINIPLGPYAKRNVVRREIRRLDAETNLTYEEIATRVNVDRRTVMRHVKGTRTQVSDADQIEMFPDHHPRPRQERKLRHK